MYCCVHDWLVCRGAEADVATHMYSWQDSTDLGHALSVNLTGDHWRESQLALVQESDTGDDGGGFPVSYTHLTLPTIYSV